MYMKCLFLVSRWTPLRISHRFPPVLDWIVGVHLLSFTCVCLDEALGGDLDHIDPRLNSQLRLLVKKYNNLNLSSSTKYWKRGRLCSHINHLSEDLWPLIRLEHQLECDTTLMPACSSSLRCLQAGTALHNEDEPTVWPTLARCYCVIFLDATLHSPSLMLLNISREHCGTGNVTTV